MNGEPLVPAEVDLRDFMYMPLDVARLRDSEFASIQTPECCWAAVLLWAASWHQVPAGSIPDDDRWIAKTAGYTYRNQVMPEWAGVREGALHGFVRCDDGRLHHPVVAEKALEGWIEKVGQRRTSAAGNASKHRIPFNSKPYDDQIAEAREKLAVLNPNSKALSKRGGRASVPFSRRAPAGSNDGQESLPLGDENSPAGSQVGVPHGSQEKGSEGTLKESEEAGRPAYAQAREPAASPPSISDQDFEAEARHVVTRWDPPKGAFRVMLSLADDREAILSVMREVVATRAKPVGTWRLWAEDVIPERLALRKAGPRIAPSGTSVPDLVFIAKGTEEWEAWRKWGLKNGQPNGYPSIVQVEGQYGWRFRSRWPPDHTDNVVLLERVA